jgi:hypothetical protein
LAQAASIFLTVGGQAALLRLHKNLIKMLILFKISINFHANFLIFLKDFIIFVNLKIKN